jgi:malonyl-CoA decarboxylase
MANGPTQAEANADRRSALLRCCAYYLVYAKTTDQEAFDPVARFHLRNGARLERINWMGDASQKGLAQSAGMLANYVYDLKRIEINHEDYLVRRTIAVAPEVVRLIPKALR